MDKKAKIADTLKIFKELINLHSDKIKDLSSYEYYFENIEEDIEDEDANELDYLETLRFNLFKLFKSFLIEYNINQVPIINNLKKQPTINNNLEEQPIIINNLEKSTFTKTPEWLRLKRSVLNPNNKDNKCFLYSGTLSFYHKQIGKNFCRISVIKPFINNINWENINFPPQKQDY